MKVTLNWLKHYVDFHWLPEELAERLTMLGLEVASFQKLAGEFDGIVVAQVITCDKHPDADKLTVCRVTDGKGERQIVCGAHNFKAGDKVPLIFPGHSLPSISGEPPRMIKVGKIRGVESHGMMCSPAELGLSEDAEGLLILRQDAQVGQPFAEYLGRRGGDVVYDLEVTANRPDLNSVIGIAREISAVTGNPLKLPELSLESAAGRTSGPPCANLVTVRIEDAKLCPRYTARVVRGVKIGPSPDWLRSTLEKVGVRSISNVVDVTNYVMLETGQPLHAFDAHLIALSPAHGDRRDACPAIIVRRAKDGETFTTLDGQARTLTSEMLLIADEQKGIALAGIMGGQNTEINDQTQDVLIESAYFKPANIRRTSKALGLRTESSYRFERGADIGITDWASLRAAQLILQTAGGQLAEGVVDACPQSAQPSQITLRHERVNGLLGIAIPAADQVRLLESIGLRQVGPAGPVRVPFVDANVDTYTLLKKEVLPRASGASVTFQVPTWRVDLQREADLIEEVARLHGVEKIPATPPRGAIGLNAFDAVHDQIAEARRILCGLGLSEAQGQTLVSKGESRVSGEEAVPVANPLSSDMDMLRPSLLPGLLSILRHNVSHKNEAVALFEIGRVFGLRQVPAPVSGEVGNRSHSEERHLALALAGPRNAVYWSGPERDAKFDAYDLKGALEEFLAEFGVRGVTYNRQTENSALFVESAVVQLGKQQLGKLGQLQPMLARQYDLRDAVFLAELNLDWLLARRNFSKPFRPLPAFPAVRRDVAMIVPETITHEAVLQVVKQARPANLESADLFDVFRGRNVPAGHKSMAYAFTYRHSERTLTDAEVNAAHERLVSQLKQRLQAVVREQD